jgi:hypothetical protein
MHRVIAWTPVRCCVQSWGEWGFVIASRSASTPEPPTGQWPLLDLKDAREDDEEEEEDEDDDEDDDDGGGDKDEFGLRALGQSGYRYLNKETMQALFFFSEDTKPTPGSSQPVNLRGTGSLFRLFTTAEARENNMDAD